jgi:hypothetical protein
MQKAGCYIDQTTDSSTTYLVEFRSAADGSMHLKAFKRIVANREDKS